MKTLRLITFFVLSVLFVVVVLMALEVPRNLEWWRSAIGGLCMVGAVRCVQKMFANDQG